MLLPSSGKNEAGLKLCIVNSITCCQAIKQNKVCGMLARSTDRGRSRQKEQHMVKAWGKEARGLAWNDEYWIWGDLGASTGNRKVDQ